LTTLMTSSEFINAILPLKNKMFRFAMSFLKMQAEAEDVVQDVMIKCWETIKDPNSIDNMEAFGMTLIRNKSLDKLKKKGRNYLQVNEVFDLASSGLSPDEKAIESDTVGRIKTLMNNLPEAQRSVVILRDIEGFSYDEIAKIQGITLQSVKVNLHRGRKKIREQLIQIESYGVK